MITVVKGDTASLAVDPIITVEPFEAGAAAPDETAVRQSIRKAFLGAEERDLHNIAFFVPPAGAGVLNQETLAKVMISEARCRLACAGSIENVVFAVADDGLLAAFAEIARRDRVVCLGDSITYGYPGGPQASWVAGASRMANISLVNEGINGDPTSSMLHRLRYDICPAAPAYVLIQGGANDVLLGYSEKETRRNIESMSGLALEAGICPILVVPPPVIPVDGFVPASLAGRMAEVMAGVGRWVRAFAEKQLLPALDFNTVLLDPQTGGGDPRYFVDGAHPNQKGYRELALVAAELLLRLKKGFMQRARL